MGFGINRFRVVGIFVVNLYYSGRNQRNNWKCKERIEKMKVKELCEVIDEQQNISVCHNNKDLDGGYPCDFLDCELVVKRISVVACEVILIET